MKKFLFSTFTIGALFVSSCKKDNSFVESELHDENQRTITTPVSEPLPVLAPTVFFVDMDTLWTVTDIAKDPTVAKKSSILNITTSGPLRENVFNFLPKFPNQTPNIIYNPFLDRLLSADGNKLYRCYTPSRNTTTNSLFGTWAIPLKMQPSQPSRLYYFCIDNVINAKGIVSINMDGSGSLEVRQFFGVQSTLIDESFAGDINFVGNKLYLKMRNANTLFVTDLNNSASPYATFVKSKLNETFLDSKIKYDDLNNQVFFSAKDTFLKKVRIYKINASGDINTLQLIIETGYVDNSHTFTFDISPETNTLFWCKREFNPNTQKHTSILTRTDLNGANPKILRTGNFINTVVVAKPA